MKKNQLISKQILLSVCLAIASIFSTVGQIYKPGDLYTFDDGTQGIVFYVDPDDPNSGSVAALHDLENYPLWEGNVPSSMKIPELAPMNVHLLGTSSWNYTGETFTRLLKLSGVSPAANAIDSGWYIPDFLQMRRLSTMVPELEEAFSSKGGEINNLWYNYYWTSTFANNEQTQVYVISNAAEHWQSEGKRRNRIRPIRDFHINNDIISYWEDFPYVSDTLVSPEVTSDYTAVVIFCGDTIMETSTVTVHQPIFDTVWDYASLSSQPYTSPQYPIFSDLDVSMVGQHLYNKGLQSINGCDSIVTLVLTVLPVFEIIDTVSWCLYENAMTMTYSIDSRITLSAENNDGMITISATSSSPTVSIEQGSTNRDFLLRMPGIHGPDSIIHLHVDAHTVARDTVSYYYSASQIVEHPLITSEFNFIGASSPGSYYLSYHLSDRNGCDSTIFVILNVLEDIYNYYDTICPIADHYDFAPFDTVFLPGTVSGTYVHHGSKVVDGHHIDTTAFLHLTVLPVYEVVDTVDWCLYENAETMAYPNDARITLSAERNGGVITVSATPSTTAITIEQGTTIGDFLLRMTTVRGCDSLVRLHVNTRTVRRDTLYYDVSEAQVSDQQFTAACRTFTDINGTGTYLIRDTLTAANGCDSIVTVILNVTEDAHYYDTICPIVDHYDFAPFDTVFLPGTVSGEYVHRGSKVVDGHHIDTTAFLHLTVLPVYEVVDTVSWCLHENAETMTYPKDSRITLSAERNGGVVTVSATSSSIAITIEQGTLAGDFLLRMTTVRGCDSLVRLHVNTRTVARDTLYYDVSEAQISEQQFTAAQRTFTDINGTGTYLIRDTLTAANSCDSIVTVILNVTEDAHYYDTICPIVDHYDFAPFDTVFLPGTVSGIYVHHGSKIVDGHHIDTTAFLHLTVLPVYEVVDTVSWCLHENAETMAYPNDSRITLSAEGNGGVVTVSATVSTSTTSGTNTTTNFLEDLGNGDFLLRMTTVRGCDSLVHLHVNARTVARDTLYYDVSEAQVSEQQFTAAQRTFTDVNGTGTYLIRDTLTAANSCDSIVTVILNVTEDAHYYDTICPISDHYDFAPFDTVFLPGTVSGEYVHHGSKVVDGHHIDTTAFLHLTVLPVYEVVDTVNWCLFENAETMTYPNDSRITLSAERNGGVVTVSATSSSTDIPIEQGASVGDFLLRMTTVRGCDSLVRLHVNARTVSRDTLYYDVSEAQVSDQQFTAAHRTFTDINSTGTYLLRDTLTATNGCDSIVTVVLNVTEDAHYYDTICPIADHYDFAPFDTVFLPGTVSGEYVHHGSKVVDGHHIDTTAFLHLTVLPVYEVVDTVNWCLFENAETMTYPNDSRITLSAERNGGVVTVSATSSSTAVIIEQGTTTGDFLLRMTTVRGCDSLVRLHVNARTVARDTLYYDVSEAQVSEQQFTAACRTFTNINGTGTYLIRDTLNATNGCDSIVTVVLTVTEDAHYYDTICPIADHYDFAPFDTVFLPGTVSGTYVHHGSKIHDGHHIDATAFLHLTVLPVYEVVDTVNWCLFENAETMTYPNDSHITLSAERNGGVVTVSATSSATAITIEQGTPTGDFLLRMTTVRGCDSLVRLHVNARTVSRDTLYYDVSEAQVSDQQFTAACRTFTDINGTGTYLIRDTLTAANGCDSIVTVVLTVTEDVHYYDTICPIADHYDFAPFDTVFLPGTVSGTYVHHGSKVVDGHHIDITAFLHLTVLPVYEVVDTVSWCLYENTETMAYPNDSRITLSAENNGGVVTVSATSSSTAVTIEQGTTIGDFLLRMTTVHGCDSLVRLHVNTRTVRRDTLYYDVSEAQVSDQQFTAACRTFTDINGTGTYLIRDTLNATNGCDSIVVIVLTVTACTVDFTLTCPPDIYDTLAFGDCAMTVYPEEIGTPTILCEEEWPFLIHNNMPESSIFPQGDNVITWIATDSICGISDTCEQHIHIAYPKCPDAIDCEGNRYAGVRIGCDCWTQRNLESTRYSDCTIIPDIYEYASLLHPDTTENVSIFGRLYSYEAAVRDSADNGYGHVQGICPEGWYLPTPEKYESLNSYGDSALRSPQYWITGGGGNSTGFTALPAGLYNGARNRYEGLLTEAYFWSVQGVGENSVEIPIFIRYACDSVTRHKLQSGLGYSVRCIKEKE